MSLVTIPQVTATQDSPQVSSRFVCTYSLPSRSNRDVKSHVSCVGADVIGFRKDLQNNLADFKPVLEDKNAPCYIKFSRHVYFAIWRCA